MPKPALAPPTLPRDRQPDDLRPPTALRETPPPREQEAFAVDAGQRAQAAADAALGAYKALSAGSVTAAAQAPPPGTAPSELVGTLVRQLRHYRGYFSCGFQLLFTPHAPYDLFFLVPTLTGCWLVLGIRCDA